MRLFYATHVHLGKGLIRKNLNSGKSTTLYSVYFQQDHSRGVGLAAWVQKTPWPPDKEKSTKRSTRMYKKVHYYSLLH